MKVQNVMSTVSAITENMSISDTEKLFQQHKTCMLPVVNNGELIGVITHNDIARALPSHATTLSKWEIGHLLDRTGVGNLITETPVVSPDMDLTDVIDLALRTNTYSFPVADRGVFLGMIYEGSIFRYFAEEMKRPSLKIEVTFKGMERKKQSFLKKFRTGGVI